jgi:pSer/pThr/pTyr-binding forkhead associated (FHA) protein/tetratricopeptide (TPR) repeat protein
VARDPRGKVVGAVPVTRQEVTIGRATESTIMLPSTAVSRKHAVVYLAEDGGVVINDEGSANGVKVDGRLISGPTLIEERHQIQISEFSLRLETDAVVVPAPEPAAPARASRETARQPAIHVSESDTDENDVGGDTMLEARSGAGAALAASTLQIVGRGGPFDGTVFKLDKPLMTVGRGTENDITLEDPSISRRHAQIRLSVTADRFTVLDLRSSNGTFLDGQRVKRAEAVEGSVVRFGDLPFRVQREKRQQERQPGGGSRRLRLWVAAGTMLALIGGIGGVAYIKRPKPKPVEVKTPEQLLREIQAEVQRHVDEARRRFNLHEWTLAVQACDEALAKDPLNAESRRLRETALQEMEHEKTYQRGLEFFALGNRENLIKAKEIFVKIPTSSIYQREARYKLKAIDERVADDYRIEGVSLCRAKRYEQCHVALCKFFELMPADIPVAGEGSLRTTIEEVEKRLARQRGFVTCQASRFLDKGGGREPAANDPSVLLEAKYDSVEVREVLLLYVEGKLDMALKKLTLLKQNRAMRPQLATLNEVDRQLLIIRGKYQEGFSALRERKVADAQKEWNQVLAADRALLPEKIESFFRREVTRSLGDLYYDLGDEQVKAGRYRQAYDLWSRGKLVDARNGRILNGLLQLENKAEALIREGRAMVAAGNVGDGRAKLSMARDIVEAGRPIRKEADKALAELGQ